MRKTSSVRKIRRPRRVVRNCDSKSYLLFVSLLVASCVLVYAPAGRADGAGKPKGDQAQAPRLTADLMGSIPTREGQRIHVAIDLGNVIVRTEDSGKIDYTVHLEADASQKDAKRLLKTFVVTAHASPDGVFFGGQTSERKASGRLWVTLQVNVPRNYNVDISTGGGNIEVNDVNGRVTLNTAGGNIVAGNSTGSARLTTEGGHITIKNVGGDLLATTGGGHITTGDITGIATLHTEGGHIQVSSIGGAGHLTTGGGNVFVEHSGTGLVAETVGGQIEVGEAAGLVHARTGGGGIHVVRVTGPTNLQTSGGNIYLTQVDGTVKASTGNGGITAWFVTPVKLPSTCELQSGDGDIIVYIPRQLPVTIDAMMPSDHDHQFFVDPALRLLVTRNTMPNDSATLHAIGSQNGGGEVVHLRTISGNIRLMASDATKQIQIYKTQMQQLEDSLQNQWREITRLQLQSAKTAP
jgi:hypothetical protein